MDDEKIQKTIDIILGHQAQFYADLQQLQEVQKEAEKRTNVLERVCLNLYNSSVEQHKTTVEQGKYIAELREAQKETDERLRETDERLNAVILMAERFLGGQNGKSE